MNATGTNTGNGYLAGGGGIADLLSTDDHKKIALMFMGWTGFAMLLGAVFGIFMVVKSLGGPGLDPRFVYQMTTYHRLLLVFLYLVPAIPSVLGYFVLPLQLGARGMALPGMARWSLRCYVIGMVLLLVSLMGGPVATGWNLAAPLAIADTGLFGLVVFGLFFTALGWFLTGVNFIVTVHHRRAKGMGFFDMPIMAWSLYLSGYQLVVAGGLFAVVVLYLLAARLTGDGLFGSDPFLWRRYFWFVATPATVFGLLSAVGVVSEIVSGISRKALAGYHLVVGSLIALLGLGFVGYGVNLVGFGLDATATLVVQSLGILAVIPAAIIAYSWLATLHKGAVAGGSIPIFVFGFMLHAGIAALMGLFMGSPAVGAYLGTTAFTAARLDYLIWGAVPAAMMAGLHWWWPKMLGRVLNDEVARIGAVLYVIGVNLALVPQIILGAKGVTADMGAFIPGPTGLSEIAALGWLVLYSGLGVILSNFFASAWGAATDEADPWGASTLEWKTSTPPPAENFTEAPRVEGIYRY